MKINNLYIKNFRRFREKSISFKNGMNVLYGQNEHGKSTVLEALLTVLYFDAKTKSKKILDQIGSWESDVLPMIRIEYSTKEGSYMLEKNFDSNTQKLVNADTNEIISETYNGIIAEVKKHTGIGSEEVFKLTALIAQNDVARVGNITEKQPIKSLRETIDSSLLGGVKVETGAVISELNSVITDLEKGLDRPAKYPGKIKSLYVKLNELEIKSSDIKESISNYFSGTKNGKEGEEELALIQKEIDELELLINNNEIREKSEKRISELIGLSSEIEKRISEIERISIRLDQTKKEREVFKMNYDLDGIDEGLLEVKTLLKSKSEEKDLLEHRIEKDAQDLSKLRGEKNFINKYIVSVASVLVVVLLFVFSGSIPLLAGSSVLLTIINVYLIKKTKGEEESYKFKYQDRISIINDELNSLEKRKADLLKKVNVSTENEFASVKSKMSSLDSEINNYQSGIDALMKTTSVEKLKEQQSLYLGEKKDIEQNILTEDVRASVVEGTDGIKMRKRLVELKNRREVLNQLITEARIQRKSSKYTSEDLSLVEEEIYQMKKQIDYYENKSRILKLVRDNIEKARIDILKQMESIVSKYAKEYLPMLTDSKYTEIKMTPEFKFMVYSNEKGDWIIPDNFLSQGTIDQIYFVIRFAILSLICKDIFPPIIIDDAFVTFDELRLNSVRLMLEKIAKNYQIIILTCHKDYSDWGNLIELK